MPEFTAPGLGKRSNHVAIDVEVGEEASGVLYALGGASGGVTLYMDKGQLVYEYNMLIIERTTAKSEAKIAPGKHKIEVDETIAKPGAPADVVLKVDGKEVARTTVKRTVPGAFTASETFDVGRRSRLARVARLLRPRTVQVRRQDREGDGRAEVIKPSISGRDSARTVVAIAASCQ